MFFKKKILKPTKRIIPIIKSMGVNADKWSLGYDTLTYGKYKLELCYILDQWEIKEPYNFLFTSYETKCLNVAIKNLKTKIFERDFK